MEVYVPSSAEGFELCHPTVQTDFETLHVQIDGTPRREAWRPIAVRLVREDNGEKLSESDSPWLGSHALVFRHSVAEKMRPVLQAHGELLPLNCAEAELYVFNATRVIEALDEPASSVLRFSSGKIMRITRYDFRPDAVAGIDLFKLPNLRVSPTFVSDRFVQAWSSAGLRGLVFNKVWSG